MQALAVAPALDAASGRPAAGRRIGMETGIASLWNDWHEGGTISP